jgi:hypothetical protein
MPDAPALSSRLLEEIRRIFPEDFPTVSALLLSYGEQSYEREVDRVRWGILNVSGNDVGKLERMLAMAKKDYRDLIVAAEYTRPQVKREHD